LTQVISLTEMRARVRYRFDLESLTARHPDADVDAEINRSWRKMRMRLANVGVLAVLDGTNAAALPTSAAASGETYAEIDWPTDAVSVHGLDVRLSDYWYPLEQVDFTSRRRFAFQSEIGSGWGRDITTAAWCVRSLPTTATTSAVAGKIMIMPVPTSGQYRLWYLPEWVDITTGSHVFPGQEGWHEWTIFDAGITALRRDNDAAGTLADARAEQATIWNDILRGVPRLADDGPIEPMPRRGSYHGPRMAP
jgi:hypothetical protein